MAGKETILSMENHELVKLLRYIRSSEMNFSQERHLPVCIGYFNKETGESKRNSERRPYPTPTEMFVLNECMQRWENGSFLEKAWWKTKWIEVFSRTITWSVPHPFRGTTVAKEVGII